jgi:hypothetical protein
MDIPLDSADDTKRWRNKADPSMILITTGKEGGYMNAGIEFDMSADPQSAFSPVDWTKVSPDDKSTNPEEDAFALLESMHHDDAMAWIEARMEQDYPGAMKEGAGGGVMSNEELGLAEDAEIIEIVDDKELVFE